MSWADWWDIKMMDFIAFLYFTLGFIVLVVICAIIHLIIEFIRNKRK